MSSIPIRMAAGLEQTVAVSLPLLNNQIGPMRNGTDTSLMRMARSAGSLPFFASLRVRLMLLVLLALMPAFGLIIYTALEQRRAGIKNAETETMRMVRLAASTQDQLIESARQLLVTLAQLKVVQNNTPRLARRFSPTSCSSIRSMPIWAPRGPTAAYLPAPFAWIPL